MIEARHLVRRYGDFVAVDDVSFVIGRSEVVGLLGHNGAGKSTIMKMLTGFLEPSSGFAIVDGVDVENEPQVAQAEIGYLPENLPLYPELSVVDYLAYTASLRGIEPRQAVADAIAATELGDKALDPIATLSRGYKQRVGVAQAILHKPRFLILDEPTNGLDPSQTQHMRDLIVQMSESATVILSTHIMQEVDAICDRALILRGGRLVVDERLENLRASHHVRVRSAPDAALDAPLANLSCVQAAESAGPGLWRLTIDGDVAAACPQIAQAVFDAGAPLIELTPVQRDLETVFREVNATTGEAA